LESEACRYFPAASFAVFVFTNWDYSWNEPNAVADMAADACLAGFEVVSFLTGPNSEVTGFRVESDFLRQLVFLKE
jgi:hypothetical protein